MVARTADGAKGLASQGPRWLSLRSTSKMTVSPPTCAASTIGPIRSSAQCPWVRIIEPAINVLYKNCSAKAIAK